MFNEKFWLAISFTAFVIFIIKFVKPLILKALDQKSQIIANEILAAKALKEKAEKLLEKAEKYAQESEVFAQKLIKDAEAEASKIVSESQKSLEAEIAKKTAVSIERIKIEEISAVRQIKTKIVELALKNLSQNFAKNIDEKSHQNLVNKALIDFQKTIH
jgi:F-type H+-transporting ATPase subunit b